MYAHGTVDFVSEVSFNRPLGRRPSRTKPSLRKRNVTEIVLQTASTAVRRDITQAVAQSGFGSGVHTWGFLVAPIVWRTIHRTHVRGNCVSNGGLDGDRRGIWHTREASYGIRGIRRVWLDQDFH
ncbi:uncharacterized protein LOC143146935 [Ptiloglossa arizonensis]|uniref:uncharacterized protein LOC143146935 n=1 Tax=Ptiloglossa arizonensis TaxID=3350558 RepID=UPI003FA03C20